MTTLIEVIERLEWLASKPMQSRDAGDCVASSSVEDCAAELRTLLTEAQGQGIVEALFDAAFPSGCEDFVERKAALASVLLAHGIQVGQPPKVEP